MRIGFAIYCFEDRALTSICFWLARELAKRDHEVSLIALSRKCRFRSERRIQEGVRLLLTPRGVTGRFHYDGWGPHDILTRVRHFFSESYDVVVSYDCRANNYLPFRAMELRAAPRIMLWGDRWGEGGLAQRASRFAFQRRIEEKWEVDMVTRAEGVIVISRALGIVAKKWGVPDSRICWIPHGSPTDVIKPIPREVARRRLGLEAYEPIIGYMGHTLGELSSFFPTFQRLSCRYRRLLILCIGSRNPIEEARVQEAGLTPYFRFTGFVPAGQVGDWLASADLLVLPLSSKCVNDSYRFPGKLGDYMAAGRPVVAPDVGDGARVIREEKIGVVVRDELDDLEEKVCELVENKALAEKLGAQARSTAEERFSWSVLADRFEAFLPSLSLH